MNKMLALASVFCYDKSMSFQGRVVIPDPDGDFNLGNDLFLLYFVTSLCLTRSYAYSLSPSLKKNLYFLLFKEVRERKLMWCDSTTDSIVWMGEDERIALSVLIDL